MKRYKFPTYEIRVARLQEHPGSLKIDAPRHALTYWQEKVEVAPWFDPEREMCVVIVLNTRLSAMAHSLVSLGTLNQSIAHPRDVFRPAIALGGYGVILMHNHPSGDPSPSECDRRLTRQLREGGQILQLGLLDHVIVGGTNYFSFRESGLI